jgi:hypothetical protein
MLPRAVIGDHLLEHFVVPEIGTLENHRHSFEVASARREAQPRQQLGELPSAGRYYRIGRGGERGTRSNRSGADGARELLIVVRSSSWCALQRTNGASNRSQSPGLKRDFSLKTRRVGSGPTIARRCCPSMQSVRAYLAGGLGGSLALGTPPRPSERDQRSSPLPALRRCQAAARRPTRGLDPGRYRQNRLSGPRYGLHP